MKGQKTQVNAHENKAITDKLDYFKNKYFWIASFGFAEFFRRQGKNVREWKILKRYNAYTDKEDTLSQNINKAMNTMEIILKDRSIKIKY